MFETTNQNRYNIESTASSLHLEEEGGAGGIFSTCLLAGAGKGKANG